MNLVLLIIECSNLKFRILRTPRSSRSKNKIAKKPTPDKKPIMKTNIRFSNITIQIRYKYIIKYLAIFPIDTNIKKKVILYFTVPAANAIGSPIIGTHENNNDHFPYFLKISVAFCNKY